MRKINVLVNDKSSYDSYIEFLKLNYDITVIKYSEYKNENINLVLFTGGEDVEPSFYGEDKGRFTRCNKSRDNLEFQMAADFYNVPKLGICRGAQFLTVHSGGRLIQHVENHGVSHNIVFKYPVKGTYEISSTHHQMMYPFNLKEEDYRICAYSEYFRSELYYNGNNKNIDLPKNFVEPEVVYYPKTKSFCIQGHPEFSSISDDFKKLMLRIISTMLNV